MQLGLTIVGGFAGAVVVFALVAWAALALLSSGAVARRLGARSPALRYGLANLRRHARANAIQVASLALGLTAVLLLSFTRITSYNVCYTKLLRALSCAIAKIVSSVGTGIRYGRSADNTLA